ncbi:MAG: FtsH protease activity modulator HflK [bacterium]
MRNDLPSRHEGGMFNVRNPDFNQWLKRFKFSLGGLTGVALVILILAFVLTVWFTVGPEEVGVILRFGRYNRVVDPGLHFKYPFLIEQVDKVPVQRQLKQEFGFRTIKAGVVTQYSAQRYDEESLMLTGDLNVASVEWIIQFRINDPYRYLFKVRNSTQTLRDMSEAMMREVVGDRTVNEVLTVGRQEIATEVEKRLQELCDQYETGIRVEQVVLQDVTPPDPVKPSFNEVNEAQQDKEKLINQALSEYNRIIPRAKGEAEQTIQQAEGYALDRVNRSQGDVALFNAMFEEYRKAPEVTRLRIYLETFNTILPKVGRKYILDPDVGGILPLLQLDDKVAKGGTP